MSTQRGAGRSLLQRFRERAGLSQVAAADRAGFSQGKLSKLEAGQLALSEADAATLADVYALTGTTRARLLQYAADTRARVASRRVILSRGAGAHQRHIGRIERDSRHIATFHPAMVPGLLQTADYMRAVFSSGNLSPDAVEDAVTARLGRQDAIWEPGRRWTQILTEGALLWHVHSPELMAAQVARIARVASTVEAVQVGIIPWTRPVDVFPMHGFQLFDQRAVEVGTTTGTAYITDPRDVHDYVTLLDELKQAAVFGDPAIRELERIAAAYQALIT